MEIDFVLLMSRRDKLVSFENFFDIFSVGDKDSGDMSVLF